MMKFRKKPIVVEAEQFFPDKMPWPEGIVWAPQGHGIQTLEGWHCVSPGDWIITGINGERYPCKPYIFEQTYEAVTGEEYGDNALAMKRPQSTKVS